MSILYSCQCSVGYIAIMVVYICHCLIPTKFVNIIGFTDVKFWKLWMKSNVQDICFDPLKCRQRVQFEVQVGNIDKKFKNWL